MASDVWAPRRGYTINAQVRWPAMFERREGGAPETLKCDGRPQARPSRGRVDAKVRDPDLSKIVAGPRRAHSCCSQARPSKGRVDAKPRDPERNLLPESDPSENFLLRPRRWFKKTGPGYFEKLGQGMPVLLKKNCSWATSAFEVQYRKVFWKRFADQAAVTDCTVYVGFGQPHWIDETFVKTNTSTKKAWQTHGMPSVPRTHTHTHTHTQPRTRTRARKRAHANARTRTHERTNFVKNHWFLKKWCIS